MGRRWPVLGSARRNFLEDASAVLHVARPVSPSHPWLLSLIIDGWQREHMQMRCVTFDGFSTLLAPCSLDETEGNSK